MIEYKLLSNLPFTMKILIITSSLCDFYTAIIIVNKEADDKKSRVHEQVYKQHENVA